MAAVDHEVQLGVVGPQEIGLRKVVTWRLFFPSKAKIPVVLRSPKVTAIANLSTGFFTFSGVHARANLLLAESLEPASMLRIPTHSQGEFHSRQERHL